MSKTVLVLSLIVAVGLAADFCWKNSYGRGAGVPLSGCKANQEKNGLLCYDTCKPGMYGVGPVCWQTCGENYKDDGAFCRKDVHIYGKGCCCTIFGCCHNCKPDYTDDGCTCRKDVHIHAKSSYGRGAGYPMICSSDQEENAALCYEKCKPNFKGVGPVCWGTCPPGWTDCGASCGRNAKECADKIFDMVSETAYAVAHTAGMIVGANSVTKAIQETTRVAKMAQKYTKLAAKIATYSSNIIAAAKAKGQTLTQAQATEMAEQTIGQFIDGMGENGAEGWEGAWDLIAKADPTGIMAAAKAFHHPPCASLH